LKVSGLGRTVKTLSHKIRALKRGRAGFRLKVFDQCNKLQDIRPAFERIGVHIGHLKVKLNGVI
jgi:hypothetical protein